MTEKNFFDHLHTLSLVQLNTLHENIILRAAQRKQQLEQQATQLATQKEEQKNSRALAKMPSTTTNLDDMANNLDLDLRAIMREISKH